MTVSSAANSRLITNPATGPARIRVRSMRQSVGRVRDRFCQAPRGRVAVTIDGRADR